MKFDLLTSRFAAMIVVFMVLLMTGRSSRSADQSDSSPSSQFSPQQESSRPPLQAVFFADADQEPNSKVREAAPLLQLQQRTKPFDLEFRASEGPRPEDYSAGLFVSRDRQQNYRNWSPLSVTWVPPAMSYQPLYFEDVPLERYGQAKGIIQPALSGARFYINLASLPYQIGVDRVHDRVYNLGYFRPGSPAPCVRQTLPLELDAAALQAAAVLGLVFVLP